MLVVPLVFVSLTARAMSIEYIKKLGRVGTKTQPGSGLQSWTV